MCARAQASKQDWDTMDPRRDTYRDFYRHNNDDDHDDNEFLKFEIDIFAN